MGEAGERIKLLGLRDHTNPFLYGSEIGDPSGEKINSTVGKLGTDNGPLGGPGVFHVKSSSHHE